MKSVVFFIFTLQCFVSFARDWCKLPVSDETYKYYQGLSLPTQSKSLAIEEALEKGRIQAVRDNFGTSYSVYKKAIETEKDISLNFEHDEYSELVYLKDFELFEQEIHEVGERFEACVLLRYKKSAIKDEQDRLKSIKVDHVRPSVLRMSVNPANRGTLKIDSKPQGAKVTINGVSFGYTPVTIEQIPPGEVQFQLGLLNYEDESSTHTFRFQEEKSFFFNLKPQKRMISIDADRYEAEVKVNGYYKGKTPLKDLEFTSLDKLTVEIIHPDTFSYITEIDLAKTTNDDFNFRLNPIVSSEFKEKRPYPILKVEPKKQESEFKWPEIDLDLKKTLLFGLGQSGIEANPSYFDRQKQIHVWSFNVTLQLSFFDFLLLRSNALYLTYGSSSSLSKYDTEFYDLPIITSYRATELSQDVLIDIGPFYFGVGFGKQNAKFKVLGLNETNFSLNDSTNINAFKVGSDIIFQSKNHFDFHYYLKKYAYKYFSEDDSGWEMSMGYNF